jgi:hypothetical protein
VRRSRALLALLAAAALGPAPAQAGWQPVERPVPAGAGFTPAVAVSPSGERLLAWTDVSKVEVASRPRVGAWSAPVVLAAPGRNLINGATPSFDAAGTATAFWLEAQGSLATARGSTRRADGTWSPPFDLPAQFSPQWWSFVTGPGGDQALVWAHDGGTVMVTIRPAGGAWSDPATVSGSDAPIDAPRLALDARGDAIVVWDVSSYRSEYAFLPSRGTWGPPQSLGGASEASVALDSGGNALAAWSDGHTLSAAYKPAGGDFGAPVALSTANGHGITPPRIAFDPHGRATLLWSDSNPGAGYDASRLWAEDRSPDGAFGGPVPVTPDYIDAAGSQLAVLADGTTLVLATLLGQPQAHGIPPRTGDVVGYTRPPGRRFDDGTVLSNGEVGPPQLASSGVDAAATWVRGQADGQSAIETAAWEPYDRAPDQCGGCGGAFAVDRIAPRIRLYLSRHQRVLATRRLALKARSDEACTLTLTVRLAGHGGKSLGRLRSKLAPGKRKALSLRLGKRRLVTVSRALRGHSRRIARLTAVATDSNGNRRTVARRIVLTR